ncbi:MAG: hypothetical protein MI976_14660, partial [Pseudomonadales bacterium]|nr:hypothetical protein [Pseudomonadales bacterium]
VAGIAVMGLFGGAARNQVAAMANEIGGGTAAESNQNIDLAGAQGDVARDDASEAVNLTNFNSSNDTLRTTDATSTTTTRRAAVQ